MENAWQTKDAVYQRVTGTEKGKAMVYRNYWKEFVEMMQAAALTSVGLVSLVFLLLL